MGTRTAPKFKRRENILRAVDWELVVGNAGIFLKTVHI
jgi:hypothetical protein